MAVQMPMGVITEPSRVSFDVPNATKHEWCKSRVPAKLSLRSSSSELETCKADRGLYFCTVTFTDDSGGEERQKTSELFEVLPPNRMGKKSELDIWPKLQPGFQMKTFSAYSPSDIYASKDKGQRFANEYLASEVPAAVFQKEFCEFTDTPPRLDEFTTNLIDDVATALVGNKLGDIIIHLRSLLAAHSFPNDAKPFVQRQFPVGGQAKESDDSRLDQFAADLAIAISFQGVAFPIVFLEHKSDDKKPHQQLFWQGISYFSYIDSYLRQMEDVAVFCPRLLIGLTPTSLSAHAVAPAAAGSKLGHSTIFREKKTVETARKVVHALLNSLSGIFQTCKFTTMPLLPQINSCKEIKSLEYTRALSDKAFEARAMISGSGGDSTVVVVKFVKESYPIGIHCQCAKEGYAPAVIAYEKRPLYTMVVMEKVEGETLAEFLEKGSAGTELQPQRIKRIVAELDRALWSLHSREYVHGDFRCTNIIVTQQGSVKIIDFDWACKESVESVYPIRLNANMRWPCAKGDQKLMLHDRYFLAGNKARLMKMLRRMER